MNNKLDYKSKIRFDHVIRRLKSSGGMTMAEMLTVVAIIVVLSGLAFIAVFNHQRNLAQLECDNTAKEIFIAAQNHLTIAKGEDFPGLKTKNATTKKYEYNTTGFGTNIKDTDNYVLVINHGSVGDGNNTIFELLLPFGSIDETVRAGGNYIINYNRSTGTVNEVYYCAATGRFAHDLQLSEYLDNNNSIRGDEGSLKSYSGDDKKTNRRHYLAGSVLGWYGGEGLNGTAYLFDAPEIRVNNGDTLSVEVTDIDKDKTNNVAPDMRLLVTGVTSGAQRFFDLKHPEGSTTNDWNVVYPDTNATEKKYIAVLDDITVNPVPAGSTAGSTNYVSNQGKHFSVLFNNSNTWNTGKITADNNFIPGEDLSIRAVAYSQGNIANVAFSNEVTTNSLYSSISDGNNDNILDTAYISSIRHLENLEHTVSNGGLVDSISNPHKDKIGIKKVEQVDDLNWGNYFEDNKVYKLISPAGTAPKGEGFVPVNSPDEVQYNGNGHSITGITIGKQEGNDTPKLEGNAGLFGEFKGGSIKNLELIDFEVAGSDTAGALAGKTENTTIRNVLARNSAAFDISKKTTDGDGKVNFAATINAGTGNAGGLVGIASDGIVEYSGAALIVNGGSAAGGLIGTSSARVDGCFSGGHTENGEFYTHTRTRDNKTVRANEIFNVQASSNGAAGGLIGSMTGGTVSNSYSTSSAFGKTNETGGFVGKKATGTIDNCYCAGLVSGGYDDKEELAPNAFIGVSEGAISDSNKISNCYYFSIINDVQKKKNGKVIEIGYKEPGPDNVKNGIKALDESDTEYNKFVGASSDWDNAVPYDETLTKYYNNSTSKAANGSVSLFNLKTVDELNNDQINITDDYYVKKHYGDWPAPEIFVINN